MKVEFIRESDAPRIPSVTMRPDASSLLETIMKIPEGRLIQLDSGEQTPRGLQRSIQCLARAHGLTIETWTCGGVGRVYVMRGVDSQGMDSRSAGHRSK